MVREFGVDMVTWLYLKWIANKDLLCSRGNSAQCYVAVWMAEEWIWGRTDTSICMVGSLCCPPKTITTLLIDYTPIQNKKLKKKEGERKHVSLQKRKKKGRNQIWFSSFSFFPPIPPSSPPAPFYFSFLPFLSPTFSLFFSLLSFSYSLPSSPSYLWC